MLDPTRCGVRAIWSAIIHSDGGGGDEVALEFDASALPELPTGWRRSFVLRSWGYCKSADALTAHGDTIEPLPFRRMSGYPFCSDEKPADPAA